MTFEITTRDGPPDGIHIDIRIEKHFDTWQEYNEAMIIITRKIHEINKIL